MRSTKQESKAITTLSEVSVTSKSNFSKFKLCYSGVKVFYPAQSNQNIIAVLNRAISNSTFDFFNLYKNIPHQKLNVARENHGSLLFCFTLVLSLADPYWVIVSFLD